MPTFLDPNFSLYKDRAGDERTGSIVHIAHTEPEITVRAFTYILVIPCRFR